MPYPRHPFSPNEQDNSRKDMKFTIRENNAEEILIALGGELDTQAAQSFATDMQPVMAEAEKHITIDFSQLEYISSTGMRTLLLLQKTAEAKGGKVTITGMSEDIRQIFQMTGFDQMIEIL